ncbi:hypothetical protein B0H14DRAFT_3439213 [Mycena olivaceomarginata]|nr:hypothetical protein B0H14DRAFT_3439213 [Mycena olivaceomarginata]
MGKKGWMRVRTQKPVRRRACVPNALAEPYTAEPDLFEDAEAEDEYGRMPRRSPLYMVSASAVAVGACTLLADLSRFGAAPPLWSPRSTWAAKRPSSPAG